MTLNLTLTIGKNIWGEEHEHTVTTTDNSKDIYFSAYDLSDCPEDATLFRDLFNGYDYIETLRLGMRLAQIGYDEIDFTTVEEE